MSTLRNILIAGAALSAAALVMPALASAESGKRPDNSMAVVEGDGSIQQEPNQAPVPPRGAGAQVAPRPASPFALMDQMQRDMDRRLAEMRARAARNPADAQSGSGPCVRSTEIRRAPGQAPQVIQRTSGNCGAPQNQAPNQAAPQPRAPERAPAPVPVPSPAPAPTIDPGDTI